MQYVLHRNDDAAARWTEAAEIYRRHVDDLAYREHLANALHDLALAHSAFTGTAKLSMR
jgi:hypothetical protein